MNPPHPAPNGTRNLLVPRCPLHVGVAMELIEVKAPSFLTLNDEQQKAKRGKAKRKFFRCGLWPACSRVAAHEGAPEIEVCPTCGKEGDAHRTLNVSVYDHRCAKCIREYKRKHESAKVSVCRGQRQGSQVLGKRSLGDRRAA